MKGKLMIKLGAVYPPLEGRFKKFMRLIPLVCSRCQGSMRVIAFIENEDVIKKILILKQK